MQESTKWHIKHYTFTPDAFLLRYPHLFQCRRLYNYGVKKGGIRRYKVNARRMSRVPLGVINRNLQPRVDTIIKSEVLTRESRPVVVDSEIWNLEQKISHLTRALSQTQQYNDTLQQEINRLSNVEADLENQRQINTQLFDNYLLLKQAEEQMFN